MRQGINLARRIPPKDAKSNRREAYEFKFVKAGGGGCFLSFGGSHLFAFLRTEGGGSMGEYITWDDLIKIAMLVIAIITCFKNKKR